LPIGFPYFQFQHFKFFTPKGGNPFFSFRFSLPHADIFMEFWFAESGKGQNNDEAGKNGMPKSGRVFLLFN